MKQMKQTSKANSRKLKNRSTKSISKISARIFMNKEDRNQKIQNDNEIRKGKRKLKTGR